MYEKFNDPMIRARLLDCLGAYISLVLTPGPRTHHAWVGFLFRAYPTLMTLESSATIMDAIFTSPEEEARGRLLKIMQDFLITESTKQSAQEKGQISWKFRVYNTEHITAAHKTKNTPMKVNMEELVGNTDGFADSG